jgi:hypothetical protein
VKRTVAVLLLMLCVGCGPTVDSNGLHVVDARVNVKLAVEAHLKDPSSASFAWAMDFKKIDEDTFVTSSYVDAKNSFGATLRTHFVARVSKSGTLKSLSLDGLDIDDKQPSDKPASSPEDKDAQLTEFQKANGVSDRIAEAAIKEWVITHDGNVEWNLADVKKSCLRNLRDGIPYKFLPESEKRGR